MTGMIAQLLAWPTLGVALLVFGFAPGVVLRLIVLFYSRGNPRRQELLGELYAVPRVERPFWVAEQLEVALFEGLRDRYKARFDRSIARMSDQLTVLEQALEQEKRRQAHETRRAVAGLAASQAVATADLLADDVSRGWRGRGWRGRGWRGTRPEAPPKEEHDPPAGV